MLPLFVGVIVDVPILHGYLYDEVVPDALFDQSPKQPPIVQQWPWMILVLQQTRCTNAMKGSQNYEYGSGFVCISELNRD